MNRVLKSPSFDKNANKLLSTKELSELEKIIGSLKKSAYLGNPLSYSFLREKRIKNKRVYFLVYDELSIILLVAISNKKTQQDTIENIKSLLKEYEEYVSTL